jgi:hypothetical protein
VPCVELSAARRLPEFVRGVQGLASVSRDGMLAEADAASAAFASGDLKDALAKLQVIKKQRDNGARATPAPPPGPPCAQGGSRSAHRPF